MAAQIGTPYNRPMGPDQNRMSGGAHDSRRPPRAGTPAPHLIRFPLWARQSVGECRACAMGAGELFKFRPLDKDDAVPTVRKAVRGRCDGRPVGTPYNGPMSLTRPDVMRGPRFTSTGPRQEPSPLTSFVSPCGPAILWAVQSMCGGFGGAFKFRPPR